MICMERTLYHGSEFIIKKPEFLKGNIHKDYGIGFYCTTNKELAKEWAAKRSGKGYINNIEETEKNYVKKAKMKSIMLV